MKRSLLAVVMAAILGVGIWLAIADGRSPASSAKPRLALLTSLPILFGEQFGLDSATHPFAARLRAAYRVEPIAVADAASLKGQSLLLMAHPRAQPAEALVDLDGWIRGGGRLLLLADPRLDWESARPLGDRLRPPPFFADTGLLGHWGLVLAGPTADGPQSVTVDGSSLLLSSPGRLTSQSPSCAMSADGLIARCSIGKGRVTVIADADLLDVNEAGGDAATSEANFALVERELAALAR